MSRLPRTLHRFSRGGQAPRGGFTLAEVAVTLLIVSFALVLILQGLNVAKFSAAQTHNRKVARELALLTLGRVQSGLYWEDLDGEPGEIPGSYAEEGYEDWRFTIGFGEEYRPDEYNPDDEESGYWDNWAHDRELERERREEEDVDDDEVVSEPYEEVYVTVYFPKLGDYPNQLTIERWVPWAQVYGQDEEAAEDPEGGDPTGGSQ